MPKPKKNNYDSVNYEEDASFEGTEFNLEDEYKPDPLVPNGTYSGGLTSMKFDAKSYSIVMEWTLNNNGGYCSDGETPLDGRRIYQRIWLPKPGDENVMTASGSMTKRQSKINMIARAFKALKIKANTMTEILELISNAEMIGLEARIEVDIEAYEGSVNNKVKKASAV